MNILTVPGIGGSGAAHWQTRWEQQHGETCTRFRPSSWDDPSPADWQRALAAAIRRLGPDTLLVAHSLGCLAVAELAQHDLDCRGAVLVAPPDVHGSAFPAAATAFSDTGTGQMKIPALVVSSTDDPYCSRETAASLATGWGAQQVEVGPLGHVNADSDLGDWLLGWYVVQGFATGLAGVG